MVGNFRRFDPTRLIQISVSIIALLLMATWGWTLSMNGRLSRGEAKQEDFEKSVDEIKDSLKEVRALQMRMWEDLRDRIEGK